MITMQRLLRYVCAEPFRPFRIHMAGGRSFEIMYPDMVAVGRSTARIFTSMSDEYEPSEPREHNVSLLLVESVEPLDVASTQEGGK